MKLKLTVEDIAQQARVYRGTGGVSAENSAYGFQPAFRDRDSGHIHLCRDAEGRPASSHRFDGVPEEWVLERDPGRKPSAVRASVVAGFVREGYFFTREQAAQLVQWELDKVAG